MNDLGFPCPLTLVCTVTGNKVGYSDPDYIKKRIDAAGSLEKLRATFVSRAGKRQLRDEPATKPTPSSPTPVAEKPLEGRIHREFLTDDGRAHTYAPRLNTEEPAHIVYDYRRKTKPVPQP